MNSAGENFGSAVAESVDFWVSLAVLQAVRQTNIVAHSNMGR